MPLDRPLEPGDRIIITTLPDGYIYHVETRDGRIMVTEVRARSFNETVARIQADGCVS